MGARTETSTSAGVAGVQPSQSHASAAATEWEMAYETGQEEQWARKVREDLRGWRGGHGYVQELIICSANLRAPSRSNTYDGWSMGKAA